MVSERLSAALADRYRIERELGQGGMATVYLAEDLKHRRRVAVKVLKPELAAVLGAERFLQEITTTAALQHPHILPLFDSGTADGFLYYVMPFVDGETLRARLDRETQLGIEDAVRITRDVADALGYAHEHGVIHRDIKPENILIANGRPVVADFGIALAVSAAASGRMTETGLSLGTPHYMSPEQATAEKEITARSDVYSLGSVLYEMLAGNPPHTGASAQQIIMKIVTQEAAPVTSLRKAVPPNVAAAVATSLEKLPADRFATAKEFSDALADHGFTGRQPAAAAAAKRDSVWKRRFLASTAVASLLLLALAAVIAGRRGTAAVANTPSMHLRVSMAAGDRIGGRSSSDMASNSERPSRTVLALSPDGQTLVYAGDRNGVSQLFVRPLASETATPIAGTDSGESPFFSPDGKSIGFWSHGKLSRIPLAGGPRTDLGSVERISGASWSDDDRIVVGAPTSGLLVFSAGGVAPPDTVAEAGSVLPQWVPGANAILFSRGGTALGTELERQVDVISVADRSRHVVMKDAADARLLASGHLMFVRRGTLLAAPFDRRRLVTTGNAVVVLDDVMQSINGFSVTVRTAAAQMAFSRAGQLVYLTGGIVPDRPSLIYWLDRRGNRTLVPAPNKQWVGLRLSPDGKRIAATTSGTNPGITIIDVERQTVQPLDNVGAPLWAIWSPDGQRVIRHGLVNDSLTLVSSPADGSRPPEPLVKTVVRDFPGFFTPDATELVLVRGRSRGQIGGLKILLLKDGSVRPVPNLEQQVLWPALSPDGKWVAYGLQDARDATLSAVYVQPWPALDRRWKISNGRGITPVWTKGGRELLYTARAAPDSVGNVRYSVYAVDIVTDTGFRAGVPKELFTTGAFVTTPIRGWDATADGSRILGAFYTRTSFPPGEIHVITNWLASVPQLSSATRK